MVGETVQIRIEIHSYWRSGTGQGRAAQHDETCIRDSDGCPYLPGRHVKGLLRDAVRRLGTWDEKLDGIDAELFGQWGFQQPARDGEDQIPYREARPGILAVTNACMAPAERKAFANDPATRSQLFRILRSTALENGVAKNTSLRAEEVAIPVTLFGEIEYIGGKDPEASRETELDTIGDWRQHLCEAAPLIRAVGGGRMRGLGRATISIDGGVS